ncbi:hypothetical protein [Phaeobacter sp. HF9A]|uniref:hypothetical protein n=1 Tax=Phaeobacter sp. HF9A TaxID=2721561 RepID=UPI00142F9758|nr:hypothetical protein [Phaeobacter sp. HF9A]NIZ13686.1 hypothetical protein [Phaeobacter sp. HF9A]
MQPALPLTLIAALGLSLAGCGKLGEDKRPKYDGVAFRVSVKPINKKETLANFRVVVKDATRTASGALQAAQHEATRYCIEKYGTSRFDWSNVTIDDDGVYQLKQEKGDGIFTGTCKP